MQKKGGQKTYEGEGHSQVEEYSLEDGGLGLGKYQYEV